MDDLAQQVEGESVVAAEHAFDAALLLENPLRLLRATRGLQFKKRRVSAGPRRGQCRTAQRTEDQHPEAKSSTHGEESEKAEEAMALWNTNVWPRSGAKRQEGCVQERKGSRMATWKLQHNGRCGGARVQGPRDCGTLPDFQGLDWALAEHEEGPEARGARRPWKAVCGLQQSRPCAM